MSYLPEIIYTSMILDFNELVNGSFLSLPAHGRVGTRFTPILVVLFAEQKTKFGGRTPVVESYVFTTGQEARTGKIFSKSQRQNFHDFRGKRKLYRLAAGSGFEPEFSGPEPDVLPLHYPAFLLN